MDKVAIATAMARVAAMVDTMAAMATAMALRWWQLWQCWWWGEVECNSNGTGGGNSSSRRGGQWMGQAAAVQCFFTLI